jgi:hypothetical protein
VHITPAKLFFENGGLLTYSSVSHIFKFGFGTRVRFLPDTLQLATPEKRLPGAGGGFLTSLQSKKKRNSGEPSISCPLRFTSLGEAVRTVGFTKMAHFVQIP